MPQERKLSCAVATPYFLTGIGSNPVSVNPVQVGSSLGTILVCAGHRVVSEWLEDDGGEKEVAPPLM
jgi:hypothetical protein